MAGILTKGMTLSYGDNEPLTNLLEIPEIGNNAPEKIDITTLTDDVKKSMSGLADSAQDLPFKFLMAGEEDTQFATLCALTDTQEWTVSLPGTKKATFSGTPSVKLGAAAPNGALTYTLNISVESKIVFA